jgi:hypothetical protein
MNAVAGSRKAKESKQVPMSLTGTKWPVEKPELLVMGEWIELGRKLRSAPDEEILSLTGSVETYLEDEVNDETLPDADYREYIRRYAKTILKATRAELGKRNLERLV